MKLALALAATLLALTATLIVLTLPRQAGPADEAQIAEAVLRSLYADNESAEQSNKAGASLCLNGKDLSAELLSAFASFTPKPLQCSATIYDKKRGALVVKSSSLPAIQFSVGEIKLLSADTAEAGGGYYEALLSSAGYSFWLVRIKEKWVVQKRIMDWIS